MTPKVGEEQLNLAEYQFLRQAGERAPTPAEVLGLRDDPPYSRGTPAVRTTRVIDAGVSNNST